VVRTGVCSSQVSAPPDSGAFFIQRFARLFSRERVGCLTAWLNPIRYTLSEADNAGRIRVTRRQLEVYREDAKAQLSWAMRHGGDRELLDALRFHINRLSEKIEQRAR
jgi:hypothetical protein